MNDDIFDANQDGVDVLGTLDEVVGVEFADIMNTLLQAGGGLAKEVGASEEKKRQMVKDGDATFAAMKQAAEAAKWPQDLTPQVVYLDKAWWDARGRGDAAAMEALTGQMRAATAQLQARLGIFGGGGGSGNAPATSGTPWWKIALGVAAAGGAGYLGMRALKRK